MSSGTKAQPSVADVVGSTIANMGVSDAFGVLGSGNPYAWVFPNGFQAVGLGLGNAIGAAIANPNRPTVAAIGDGGAFMALVGFLPSYRRGDHSHAGEAATAWLASCALYG